MKRARYILVRRGAERGFWVAPPNVDANTATAEQLLLHITSAIPQLAMQGVVAPAFPKIVPHLLGYAPLVLPNLISTKVAGGFSYQRPFDNVYGPWIRSNVKCEATQLTIDQENLPAPGPVYATPLDVNYFVYNRPIPT